MNDIIKTLHKALNTICGLSEFELDFFEKKALQEVLPLFESSYALLTTIEDIVDISTVGEIKLSEIHKLVNYAKSGFKNENQA